MRRRRTLRPTWTSTGVVRRAATRSAGAFVVLAVAGIEWTFLRWRLLDIAPD
jgi:hypothetical protein